MERNTLKIRPLTEDDYPSVRSLDEMSGCNLLQWLEDNEDYAWGCFLNGQLIGYCSIGYADDVCSVIEDHPLYSCDALLLSDVFVVNEFQGNNYGKKLIIQAIKKRWTMESACHPVYACAVSREIVHRFYEKVGFKSIDSTGEIILITPDLMLDE